MTRDEYEARQNDLNDQIAVLQDEQNRIVTLLCRLRSEKINLAYRIWMIEPLEDSVPLASAGNSGMLTSEVHITSSSTFQPDRTEPRRS